MPVSITSSTKRMAAGHTHYQCPYRDTDRSSISDLFGVRDKIWLSYAPFSEVVSAGGAFAWSSPEPNVLILATSIQFNVEVTPLPSFLSGGYNRGIVKPWKSK